MAGGKGAKVAVGLGLVPLVFGAYQVYDRVYDWYDVNQMPPVIAIFAVGVLLVAIGLGKLKTPVLGVVLVLAGAGYVAACLKLGKTHDAARMRGYEDEIALGKAAMAVCNGTPNAAASSALVDGKRPVMGAGHTSTGEDGVGVPWEGLPAPKTLAELQLVACTDQTQDFRNRCDYQGKDGAGAYTITFYRLTNTVTVKDARTLEVLGSKTFEGAEPDTSCDSEIKVERHEDSNHEVNGRAPSRDEETAFVRQFVDGKKP